MLLTTRLRDGVTIADLSGRLTAGDGAPVLRDEVNDLHRSVVERSSTCSRHGLSECAARACELLASTG
jgi:hypothetical protein